MTLAAGAFPQSLSDCPPDSISFLPRADWTLWHSLVARSANLARVPDFGDYAVAHPLLSDVDPQTMRPSAAIRYTIDDHWLVLKARGVIKGGYDQFHQLCSQLVARSEYSGSSFSWGDNYIDQCAARNDGPGNLTTWVSVRTSHHLKFVVHQIANLPLP